MPHRLTAFGTAVAKLKSPAAADFSAAAWDAAYHAHSTSRCDERLFTAAQWIGTEAHAGRLVAGASVGPVLASLTPEWGTILAIAALNREYRTAVALKDAQNTQLTNRDVLAADAIAAERIQGAGSQLFAVADLAELGIDMTENWLFDAAHSTGTIVPTGNLAPTAIRATQSYSFRKSLNTLWNGAWIDGDFCEQAADGKWRWRSGDPARARLIAAWQARQEANLMNFPNIDRTVWPKLKPAARRKQSRGWGVTNMIPGSNGTVFKVSALQYPSRYMPAYNYERAGLEGSYLIEFLGSTMNGKPALTVSNLLLAWHAIYDIAKLLVKRAPLPTTLSPSEARALAMVVGRGAVCDAIRRSVRVSEADADAIVTFLTFAFQTGGTAKDAGNKGLWAAPLVPVPGTDNFVLPLSVLVTSNPARRAEAWLEKGGINDSNPKGSRGDRYEEFFRAKACKAVAGNTKFTAATCAATEIKKSKVFGEQVDLLVAFGGLCLVGEVKFFLMPSDPHERDRYDVKLTKAAAQAKRKAAALDIRRDVIADHLGISLAKANSLRLLPIVVTAQGYGFSTKVANVLIIEAEFLRLFLMGGDLVTGRALIPATGQWTDVSTVIYGTEAAAARNFEEIMSEPFVLTRFLDRVEWGKTMFPSIAHNATEIDVVLLGDLKGFERMQAEAMRAELV